MVDGGCRARYATMFMGRRSAIGTPPRPARARAHRRDRKNGCLSETACFSAPWDGRWGEP
eukprot:2573302-Prymnesium_polylepis.1